MFVNGVMGQLEHRSGVIYIYYAGCDMLHVKENLLC